MKQGNNQQNELSQTQRRNFIKQGLLLPLSGEAGLSYYQAANTRKKKDKKFPT